MLHTRPAAGTHIYPSVRDMTVSWPSALCYTTLYLSLIPESMLFHHCKVDCLQGPLLAAVLLLACAAVVYRRLSNQVYLLDFACYRPADEYQVTWKRFMAGSRDCGVSCLYFSVVCELPCVENGGSCCVACSYTRQRSRLRLQQQQIMCLLPRMHQQCPTSFNMLVANVKASRQHA